MYVLHSGLQAHSQATDAGEPVYYCDRIRFWLTKKLTKVQHQQLDDLLGLKHRLFISTKRMKYQPRWVQRIDVLQPSTSEIQLLAKTISGAYLINYVEVARDECGSPSWDDLLDLRDFRDAHEVRLWHPNDQEVVLRYKGTTTYDARRGKPRVIARYANQCCRITGEINCLHTEFRFAGKSAVQRAGIITFEDLIAFDHRAWWRKKSKVVTIDAEALGRKIRNAGEGTRDSEARFERWGKLKVNVDLRAGTLILRSSATLQDLLDTVSKHGDQAFKRIVRQSLHRVDEVVEHGIDKGCKSLATNVNALLLM